MLNTGLWSYSGGKDFMTNPRFATAWHVAAQFPPTYISADNADQLLPQSIAFAATLAGLAVRVERPFFPNDYKPEQPHEYRFNSHTDAGGVTLERSIEFLLQLR